MPELSDFDPTGLLVECLARLELGSEVSGVNRRIYANSDRPPEQGSILDGELLIGPGEGVGTETEISRIFIIGSGDILVINDNDNPNTLTLSQYFGVGGEAEDSRIYILTDDWNFNYPIISYGGGYANTSITDQIDRNRLNALADGDIILFAIAKSIPLIYIAFGFSYEFGTSTIAITKRLIDTEQVAFIFSYELGTSTTAVTKRLTDTKPIAFVFSYEPLTSTTAITKRLTDTKQIAFGFSYEIGTSTTGITKRLVDKEPIAFVFSYESLTSTIGITKRLVDKEPIAFVFSYELSTSTTTVTKRLTDTEQIAFVFSYGLGTSTTNVTKVQSVVKQITFTFEYQVSSIVLSLVKNFSMPLFGFRCDNESYIIGFCSPNSTWLSCIQNKRLIGFLYSYETSITTAALRKIEVQDPKQPFYDVFKDFLLVEERINKVLTQYRESPRLLGMYRAYLRQMEIVGQVLENIAQVFSLDRAVGDQLELIGRRMGWPRKHTLCARESVFGFGGGTESIPIVGLCEPLSTWNSCAQVRSKEYTINDNYTYRKFLKVRRYQALFLYALKFLRQSVKILWGDNADIISLKENEVIVATGRRLNAHEASILGLYVRVLPVFPTVKVFVHMGHSNIFGFGDGQLGFCEQAEWLCPIDPEPYRCIGD